MYLPLYQGRMIGLFDHRANSIQVNLSNTHNPYLSVEVSEAQHVDPSFLPKTQYWVPSTKVSARFPQSSWGGHLTVQAYHETNRLPHNHRHHHPLVRSQLHYSHAEVRRRRFHSL